MTGKGDYIENIKTLDKEELKKERNDLMIEMMKARNMIQTLQNPYGTKSSPSQKYDIKNIKWKLRQVMSRRLQYE